MVVLYTAKPRELISARELTLDVAVSGSHGWKLTWRLCTYAGSFHKIRPAMEPMLPFNWTTLTWRKQAHGSDAFRLYSIGLHECD